MFKWRPNVTISPLAVKLITVVKQAVTTSDPFLRCTAFKNRNPGADRHAVHQADSSTYMKGFSHSVGKQAVMYHRVLVTYHGSYCSSAPHQSKQHCGRSQEPHACYVDDRCHVTFKYHPREGGETALYCARVPATTSLIITVIFPFRWWHFSSRHLIRRKIMPYCIRRDFHHQISDLTLMKRKHAVSPQSLWRTENIWQSKCELHTIPDL